MKFVLCFPIDWLNIHLSCYYNFYDGIKRHVKLFEKNNIAVEFLNDFLSKDEFNSITNDNWIQLQNHVIDRFFNILINYFCRKKQHSAPEVQ